MCASLPLQSACSMTAQKAICWPLLIATYCPVGQTHMLLFCSLLRPTWCCPSSKFSSRVRGHGEALYVTHAQPICVSGQQAAMIQSLTLPDEHLPPTIASPTQTARTKAQLAACMHGLIGRHYLCLCRSIPACKSHPLVIHGVTSVGRLATAPTKSCGRGRSFALCLSV